MATVYLSQSTKTDAKGENEILMRFSHGKINQRAKTNIFLNPKYWNAAEQCIHIPKARLLTPETKSLIDGLNAKNEKLSNIVATVSKSFNETDKAAVAPDWLRTIIDKTIFPEKYLPKEQMQRHDSLFQFIDGFIANAPQRKDAKTGLLLSKGTLKQYPVTRKMLCMFAGSIRKKDFKFGEVNIVFYNNFVAFLQAENYSQNNIGKHIKMLKTFLTEASRQHYPVDPCFKDFKVFREEVDTIALDEAELQQIKDKDLSHTPHLDRVRDWFLLLCWTGCRFSDLEKIGKTDIKDGLITFRQQKTNNKVVIPLHPVVLEILEKYEYDMPEPITNQRFNEYIKNVCELAGIDGLETLTITRGGKLTTETYKKWELVSSHTGRRSFCTNMYKRGLPTIMIMSISGHRTEKSFLSYIKVKQEEHAAMMAKEWARIYN